MKTYIILLFVIAAIILTLVVMGWIFYKLFKTYFDNQQKALLLQMKRDERAETLKVITPIRLQAYERMAPDSLILRCYQPGMDLKLLQGVMTKNIRDEWEHNLSQQIYLTSESWSRIREAKDEMINTINSSAVSLAPDADPTTLAATIFAAQQSQSSRDEAIEFLKNELNG